MAGHCNWEGEKQLPASGQFPVSSSQFPVRHGTGYWKLVTGNWNLLRWRAGRCGRGLADHHALQLRQIARRLAGRIRLFTRTLGDVRRIDLAFDLHALADELLQLRLAQP